MHRVTGVVQHYAWGDTSTLPELLGVESDGRPWAEVWFGTHRNGPSDAVPMDGAGGLTVPLSSVAGQLPFLAKLLSAAAPLSLQTHPSAAQAAAGYAREQSAGIPLTSSTRVYVDPLAKPELLIALTPFRALCGIRPLAVTEGLLRDIGGTATRMADRLADQGVEAVVSDYLVGRRSTLPLVEACRRSDRPEARLVLELAKRYPADPAVAVTLLLNLVNLRAGQALYLPPGNLHAYLKGTGVEVMGASDNVLRAGLTRKHVAPTELMQALDTNPLRSPTASMDKVGDGRWLYATPDAPFVVHAQHVKGPTPLAATTRELVVVATGETDLMKPGEVTYLAPGEELTLDGVATVFRVSEPV